MSDRSNELLLSASAFLTWLYSITTSQVIGVLTVLVLLLTGLHYYYSYKKSKLEIQLLRKKLDAIDEQEDD